MKESCQGRVQTTEIKFDEVRKCLLVDSIFDSYVVMLQSTDIEDTDFILRSHMEDINRLFDGETVEEIMENLKNDGSEWATKQLNVLNKMVCSVSHGLI